MIDHVLARVDAETEHLSSVGTRERLRGARADVAHGVPPTLGVVAALDALIDECTDDVNALTEELSAAITAVGMAHRGYDRAQADMALSTQAASPSGTPAMGSLRA